MASVFKRGGKKGKGKWIAAWFDHKGKRQTKSTRTTDKAAAERIARKYEADAALRRDGVIDATLDAISQESQRTIESHLADYENKLRAANRTEKHINSTANFVRQIAEHTGFIKAEDISADGVNQYARSLKDSGRAARTVQAHLNAIKAFTKWLSENHKLPRDPLASVKKPNVKTDRRRERRMLLPKEWHHLRTATAEGPERDGMSAVERSLLYRTAIQTGLRANELRSLTRGNLYLDGDQPYVTCKAGSTKNRKDARQYIQPELAAELKAHISTKSPKAPVFGLPHETYLGRMIRADLSAARNAWLKEAIRDPDKYAKRAQSDFLADTNHDGQVFDFHCLRHTCGAWLAMRGVHPKVVQTVMRHSAITLTMDTYGHLCPGQEADAVGQLRDMFSDPVQALRATGTDDIAAQSLNKSAAHAQRTESESGQADATGCDDAGEHPAQKESPKPLAIADLGDDVQIGAMSCDSSGGGTRTPDTRIMIPLL